MTKATMFGLTRFGVAARQARLFVVADPATVSDLAKALGAESDFEVVGEANNGRACLEHAASSGCDIIIVQSSLPDISGAQVAECLSISHPEIATVIVAEEPTEGFLRTAMLSGAREVLRHDCSFDEIAGALRRVFDIERERRQKRHERQKRRVRGADKNGRMVVVCSGKGGTGKSFLAVNLSVMAAQAHADKKIALVDMDLSGGDIGVLLDIDQSKGIGDLLSVVSELDGEMLKAAARSYSDNLDCYLAPIEDVHLDSESIAPLVASLSREYDLIVVNTGSPACWPTAELMSLADLLLMVTTPDLASLKSCTRLRDAHEELGLLLSKVTVVVNQAMERDALTEKRVGKLLALPVTGSVPFDGYAVRDLVNKGVPISAKKNKSLFEAMSYVHEKTIVRGGLI